MIGNLEICREVRVVIVTSKFHEQTQSYTQLGIVLLISSSSSYPPIQQAYFIGATHIIVLDYVEVSLE